MRFTPLLLATLLSACKNDPPPPAPPAVSATPAVAPPSASVAAEKLPPKLDDFYPRGFQPPDKPTKPPTVAEWKDAPEVEVKNGKQLACEVKLVREWIRVSCRTTDDRASQIKGMKLLQPELKPARDFYEMVKPDTLASAVFPIRKETHVRIEFSWTDFSRILSVAWTPGAPKPGIFFDKASPKDLSKPSCIAVCGLPYFPGRGTMACPPTHDPTDGEDNGCMCRKFANEECTTDW